MSELGFKGCIGVPSSGRSGGKTSLPLKGSESTGHGCGRYGLLSGAKFWALHVRPTRLGSALESYCNE